MTSRNSGSDTAGTSGERVFHKTSPQDVAAIEPAPRPDSRVKQPKDSRQKTDLTGQRNLASLGQNIPAPRAGAEFQKPRSEPAPPGFSPAEAPRATAPITSDLPKPSQPPVEKPAEKMDPPKAAQPPVEKADSTPSESPMEKVSTPKQPEPPATKSNPMTGFMEAVLIQHDPPEYPASAIKKHIGGRVTVNATVGTDGVPRNLKLVMGDPTLGQAAEEAIVHWRYVPAVSAGVPVESQVAITINFQTRE
jgi:protein TonB